MKGRVVPRLVAASAAAAAAAGVGSSSQAPPSMFSYYPASAPPSTPGSAPGSAPGTTCGSAPGTPASAAASSAASTAMDISAVVSIDLGTTRSGFAWALPTQPDKIYCDQGAWVSATPGSKIVASASPLKALTGVLFRARRITTPSNMPHPSNLMGMAGIRASSASLKTKPTAASKGTAAAKSEVGDAAKNIDAKTSDAKTLGSASSTGRTRDGKSSRKEAASTSEWSLQLEMFGDEARSFYMEYCAAQSQARDPVPRLSNVCSSPGGLSSDMVLQPGERWLYFEQFKMLLYPDHGPLSERPMSESFCGVKVPAMDVFVPVLAYLKAQAFARVNACLMGLITDGDVLWVLTVPAIWEPGARQFMREAALKAGFTGRLMLALESEAAAICCRERQRKLIENLPALTRRINARQRSPAGSILAGAESTTDLKHSNASAAPPAASSRTQSGAAAAQLHGVPTAAAAAPAAAAASPRVAASKPRERSRSSSDRKQFSAADEIEMEMGSILLMDLGGGTGDLTVHRPMGDGTVGDACASRGGKWGSTYVDAAFERLVASMLPEGVYQRFIKERPDARLELLDQFEIAKCQATPKNHGGKPHRITLPYALLLAAGWIRRHPPASASSTLDPSTMSAPTPGIPPPLAMTPSGTSPPGTSPPGASRPETSTTSHPGQFETLQNVAGSPAPSSTGVGTVGNGVGIGLGTTAPAAADTPSAPAAASMGMTSTVPLPSAPAPSADTSAPAPAPSAAPSSASPTESRPLDGGAPSEASASARPTPTAASASAAAAAAAPTAGAASSAEAASTPPAAPPSSDAAASSPSSETPSGAAASAPASKQSSEAGTSAPPSESSAAASSPPPSDAGHPSAAAASAAAPSTPGAASAAQGLSASAAPSSPEVGAAGASKTEDAEWEEEWDGDFPDADPSRKAAHRKGTTEAKSPKGRNHDGKSSGAAAASDASNGKAADEGVTARWYAATGTSLALPVTPIPNANVLHAELADPKATESLNGADPKVIVSDRSKEAGAQSGGVGEAAAASPSAAAAPESVPASTAKSADSAWRRQPRTIIGSVVIETRGDNNIFSGISATATVEPSTQASSSLPSSETAKAPASADAKPVVETPSAAATATDRADLKSPATAPSAPTAAPASASDASASSSNSTPPPSRTSAPASSTPAPPSSTPAPASSAPAGAPSPAESGPSSSSPPAAASSMPAAPSSASAAASSVPAPSSSAPAAVTGPPSSASAAASNMPTPTGAGLSTVGGAAPSSRAGMSSGYGGAGRMDDVSLDGSGAQKVAARQVPGVKYRNGHLEISHETMLSFFEPVINPMTACVSAMLDEAKDVSQVFMVGGFAQNAIVQDAVQRLLKARYGKLGGRLITPLCPPHPSLAVLTGAVMFGLNPRTVSARAVANGYGIAVSTLWDEARHGATAMMGLPARPKVTHTLRGKAQIFCENIWHGFCEAGEVIAIDHVVDSPFTPGADGQERMQIRIYQTFDRIAASEVAFVDDATRFKHVGSLTVALPLLPVPAARVRDAADLVANANRTVRVFFEFGGTEIRVRALDEQTKKACSATLSFLDRHLDGTPVFAA